MSVLTFLLLPPFLPPPFSFLRLPPSTQIQRFEVAGIGLTDFEREGGGPPAQTRQEDEEEDEEEDCSKIRDGLRVRIFASRRSAEHAVAHHVMETS